MIGNDIVDLKHIVKMSNWKRPRFLDKVFTAKEQALIVASENQHELVWLLWSMKEAAYKCHVQQFGERFFNPIRLVCEFVSEDKGIVRIDDNCYFTTSTITEDFVYTIAKQDQPECVKSSIFETETLSYGSQSNRLKQQFLRTISIQEGYEFNTLNIKKSDAGIPHVFNESTKLSLSFSLTHCGRFSGFAY